jgi:hypothetical protein
MSSAIGVGHVDHLVEPGGRVAHMRGVGQWLLPPLRNGEDRVGQVAPLGEMAVLLVRFPGCFGCHNPPPPKSCTATPTPRRVSGPQTIRMIRAGGVRFEGVLSGMAALINAATSTIYIRVASQFWLMCSER